MPVGLRAGPEDEGGIWLVMGGWNGIHKWISIDRVKLGSGAMLPDRRLANGRPHGLRTLSPKPIVLGDSQISKHPNLASQTERAIGGMRRQGSPRAISPVCPGRFPFNFHGTGATTANPATIDEGSIAIVQSNSTFE